MCCFQFKLHSINRSKLTVNPIFHFLFGFCVCVCNFFICARKMALLLIMLLLFWIRRKKLNEIIPMVIEPWPVCVMLHMFKEFTLIWYLLINLLQLFEYDFSCFYFRIIWTLLVFLSSKNSVVVFSFAQMFFSFFFFFRFQIFWVCC